MTRLRPATAGATVGKQCNTSLYAGISLHLLCRKVRSGDNQQETRKRILRDYTRRNGSIKYQVLCIKNFRLKLNTYCLLLR